MSAPSFHRSEELMKRLQQLIAKLRAGTGKSIVAHRPRNSGSL
jgi:hypothetical protein